MADDGTWLATADAFQHRHPRRHDRIDDYRRLLQAGEHRRLSDAVLAGRHRPAPPAEAWLNKLDGKKKRVFHYPPPDELLFRTVNRLPQPAAAEAASPWCRSFLPGGGARAAFRGLLADRNAGTKSALHLDIHDYFNSVDPVDLLGRLPELFAHGPVLALLRAALLDPRVQRGGVVVEGGQKGIMAGTPLAPLLATLYLRDLDAEIVSCGATYARYSDDFLILAAPTDLAGIEQLVRHRVAERRLAVNESKTAVAAAGDPWDFLGFRYHSGSIGLAPVTEAKFRARTTRLARSLLRWRERSTAPPERAARTFLRRVNRRLYGVPEERSEFSWATWFLPMLDRPDQLHGLDLHVQREARYAATGQRRQRTRGSFSYATLVANGHLPLVAAYWAQRDGTATYDALVTRRTGLNPGRTARSLAGRQPR